MSNTTTTNTMMITTNHIVCDSPSQFAEACVLQAIQASRAAGDYSNSAAYEVALSSFSGDMFTYEEACALATAAVAKGLAAYKAKQEAAQFIQL